MTGSASRPSADTRIAMIDTARLLGIFLVFHAHLIERAMHFGVGTAADQYKFINAFHMPLFFVLAGFVAKDWAAEQSFGRFVKTRALSRVLPLVVFYLLLLVLSLVAMRDFPRIFALNTPADYLNAVIASLVNYPVFNLPTWFLMCLVSVEFLHFFFFRFLRGSTLAIVVGLVVFYVVGLVANRLFAFVNLADPFRWNWWFLNEAVTMYGFYLLGVLMRRQGFLMGTDGNRWLYAALALVGFAIVAATFGLNTGPFRMRIYSVVILLAAHGNELWFTLTALAGIVSVMLLARALPPYRWLTYMGASTLTLFCLNGVFYHHLNGLLAKSLIVTLPQNEVLVSVAFVIATVACLVITVPFVLAFNRWLPQLIGRPGVSGPLLPSLI